MPTKLVLYPRLKKKKIYLICNDLVMVKNLSRFEANSDNIFQLMQYLYLVIN